MKRLWQEMLLTGLTVLALIQFTTVRAETEVIDLKALAKKARPAVMLLVVSDTVGKEIATGTGFLISSDGKLVTNHHVIEGAASVVAKADNGGLFPVEGVLADDPTNDLVLLKLKAKDLPFLVLGNSEKIEVGTRIAVIGSPLGLEGTLSEGIVSAVRDMMGEMRIIQITAPVSHGSSGSPVLNGNGNVIGIATALLDGGQSLNFAVPVEVAINLLAESRRNLAMKSLHATQVSDKDKLSSDPDGKAAIAAYATKDYLECLKRARVLVERYPDNALAHGLLGFAYHGLNFDADAISACQQAVKLKPDWAGAWHMLGWCYSKVGQIDYAIAAYQQALKLQPDWAEVWNDLGLVYRQAGRTDEAINAFERAKKLKPEISK